MPILTELSGQKIQRETMVLFIQKKGGRKAAETEVVSGTAGSGKVRSVENIAPLAERARFPDIEEDHGRQDELHDQEGDLEKTVRGTASGVAGT